MTSTDFQSQFQALADYLSGAAKSVMSKIDQVTFRMLVDNLKQGDYDVVREVVDQLLKEKRPLAIPPLYFVSRAHPNPYVRDYAGKAITQFAEFAQIEELSAGKSADEATRALIAKFGNFRG
jgi:hypothetical protein